MQIASGSIWGRLHAVMNNLLIKVCSHGVFGVCMQRRALSKGTAFVLQHCSLFAASEPAATPAEPALRQPASRSCCIGTFLLVYSGSRRLIPGLQHTQQAESSRLLGEAPRRPPRKLCWQLSLHTIRERRVGPTAPRRGLPAGCRLRRSPLQGCPRPRKGRSCTTAEPRPRDA